MIRCAKASTKPLKPDTSYIYRNQDGEPVLIANRFNKPDGGKFFVPFDVTRNEWKAPETRPLYNLDKLMQADPAEPVVLVEGEKCADALTALGYLATTTYGGCNALRKADLSPLCRRTVMLWPDLDAPGLSYVGKAALTVHRDFEAVPKVVPITETLLCNVMIDSGGNLPAHSPMYCKGWDAADAIAEGWGNALIDRLLSYAAPLDAANCVTLPVIAPTDRAFEGEFNKALDAAMPRILAGLLDAVSTALANLSSVRLTERPRMADFAKWVSGAEPTLGWTQGAFLEAYAANRDSGDRATVEGNPVGLAILKLVQDVVRWSGTMTELKTILRNRYPMLTDDPYSFPRQENKLSAAIRKIMPPLRRMGVEISFDRRGHSGERILRIERA